MAGLLVVDSYRVRSSGREGRRPIVWCRSFKRAPRRLRPLRQVRMVERGLELGPSNAQVQQQVRQRTARVLMRHPSAWVIDGTA